MFNAEKPSLDALPSSAQLLRSTAIAGLSAAAILVAVVLPAEYGIDPTGMGRVLGLTEMGEIKQELAREAEEDAQRHGAGDQDSFLDDLFGLFVSSAHAQEAWQDVVTFSLEPGEHTEVKMLMDEGDTADYAWTATGGRISFDLHAHGEGQSVNYDKDRGATEGEGSIEAPFAGEHGWFWRNRDKSAVKVTLHLRGTYDAVVSAD
ncbi:MAG: transmembrane anchor protein [Pseudomonadota bacterium]